MKAILTFAALSLSCMLTAQSGKSENGLIYSDTAIEKLGLIVDSLDLEFSASESEVYVSGMQGIGSYFFIRKENAKEALKNIESGMSFRQLAAKYPQAEMEPKILVARERQENGGVLQASFMAITLGMLRPSVILKGEEAERALSVTKGWVYSYSEEDDALSAFYFEKEMTCPAIPERYARLAQYTDKLMDPSAAIYFSYAWECTAPYIYIPGPKMEKFRDYLNDKLKRPVYREPEEKQFVPAVDTLAALTLEADYIDGFYDTYNKWESTRIARVDSLMQQDGRFRMLFEDALDEASNHLSVTDEEFEEYTEKYDSKEQALYFKRCRKVISSYQDHTGRRHMFNIARLAGETTEWEIFLRAHMSIMNERIFHELPEFSPDTGKPFYINETYIKELEAINVNVVDFLLGLGLRLEILSDGYDRSPFRLSKPLAEALDREVALNALLVMIADRDLDDYNRATMYHIYRNYNLFADDEAEKAKNFRKLEEAAAFLPDYLLKTIPD